MVAQQRWLDPVRQLLLQRRRRDRPDSRRCSGFSKFRQRLPKMSPLEQPLLLKKRKIKK
jgi:hypothetical protein